LECFWEDICGVETDGCIVELAVFEVCETLEACIVDLSSKRSIHHVVLLYDTDGVFSDELGCEWDWFWGRFSGNSEGEAVNVRTFSGARGCPEYVTKRFFRGSMLVEGRESGEKRCGRT
jgi:hypothetical protein